jgi:hypothetical protein
MWQPPNTRHKPGLIAKIERAEAIPHLEEILRASDGIMVARGDLAVEVGNATVPALQKRMIKLARQHDKVVITATQMMESMITNPVPTRAEVSDVANAVLDGTDAVMLSAETAAGKYPLETVMEMAKICEAAEAGRRGPEHGELDADFNAQTFTRIDQSIAMGALFTAHHLGRQGHRGADRLRFHAAVDEPPSHQHPDLRDHVQAGNAAQDGAVPQCASVAGRDQRRSRCRPDAGGEPPQGTAASSRPATSMPSPSGEPMGSAGRHQHAAHLPGRVNRGPPSTTPAVIRRKVRRGGRKIPSDVTTQ